MTNVRTDLLLYSTLEWKISSFFRCIGLKKQGEKLQMNWSKVPGARGRAHFKPRTYTANDGTERIANECTRFYDYDEANFKAADRLVPLDDDTDIPF